MHACTWILQKVYLVYIISFPLSLSFSLFTRFFFKNNVYLTMIATHELVVPKSIPITSPASLDLNRRAIHDASNNDDDADDDREEPAPLWKMLLGRAAAEAATRPPLLVIVADVTADNILLACK
jgi:hypothetical protein